MLIGQNEAVDFFGSFQILGYFAWLFELVYIYVIKVVFHIGLQLDIDQGKFEVQSTKYLGFIVEAGKCIRMDPEKVKAIMDWEAPHSVKGIRSFLGFANFYD